MNDGSTDDTGAIIDAAAAQYPWIRTVHRRDRGFRLQGGGVVETFYDGFKAISDQPWDFLVKLDADLSFDSDYFERCIARFEKDPQLGIGGGVICHKEDGSLKPESPGDPLFHVRGATKIYRRSCWDQLDGLERAPGWDTIDELKAWTLGWTTSTFVEIPLWHHRFTGTVDGTWRNSVKFGVANYIAGYSPIFMTAKCLRRIFQRPLLVGAIALAWGYLKGPFHQARRVSDPRYIAYVRKQQLAAVLGRPSLWSKTVAGSKRP